MAIVRFAAAQYDYMLDDEHLSAEVRGQLAALGGPANGRERAVDLDNDTLIALRDELTARFDTIGFDEDYELTREGEVLDVLIALLVPE
jgi:hypothetical protein